MEIKSTSKINLGLHVHNKRMDGFHNISTLFQEIDLCDTIKIIEDKKFSCTTDCGTILENDNQDQAQKKHYLSYFLKSNLYLL